MDEVLDLGNMHVSAFPEPGESDGVAAPVKVVHCANCNLLQLQDITNPDLLYRTYWYRSGTNQTMRDALRDIAASCESRMRLSRGDVVVDIGSNDGTLLASYKVPGVIRYGFEPSNIAEEAKTRVPDATIIRDYFAPVDALRGKASVVTSIAMFYDLEDPHAFVEGVKATLKKGGLWVLQLAYLPAILERNAFDGMCHEHVAYYSLQTMERLLHQHGLTVVDAKLVDLNEGSIRLYVQESGEPSAELLRLRRAEDEARLGDVRTYQAFAGRVELAKAKLVEFIRSAKRSGKKIHAYGASTKGNTLLQFYGLTNQDIDAIWERQPQKWGRETVGTRIPIISEEAGRAQAPDFLVMLPWHFASEFIRREQEYLRQGGAFLVPLPEFRLVTGAQHGGGGA